MIAQDECGWQQDQVNRVGDALKALRGDRSAQWLSDVTDELGQRVSRSTISDIENRRRKYVAVHEISMLAAALGVTPATLLTWGSLPDGDVELLPGRMFSGMEVADWWGGTGVSRFSSSSKGLPADRVVSAELISASRERARLRNMLTSLFGSWMSLSEQDEVRVRLRGVIRRIGELGGTIHEGVRG